MELHSERTPATLTFEPIGLPALRIVTTLAAKRMQAHSLAAARQREGHSKRIVADPTRSNYRGDITVRPSTLPQGPTSGAETPLIRGKFEFNRGWPS